MTSSSGSGCGPGDRVVLAVDVSGSMRGERECGPRRATVGALAGQLDRDDPGGIAFWSDAAVLARLGQRVPAGRLLDTLLRIPDRGLTNIWFPLQIARRQLAAIPRAGRARAAAVGLRAQRRA